MSTSSIFGKAILRGSSADLSMIDTVIVTFWQGFSQRISISAIGNKTRALIYDYALGRGRFYRQFIGFSELIAHQLGSLLIQHR